MRKVFTISQYIKEFTTEAAAKLAPFVLSGKLNIEFIKGNQNKRIVGGSKIESLKQSGGVYTENKVFNRILPIYLTRFGILSKNMPIPGFKPHDNSAKRQFDAVRGNDFINSFIVDEQIKKDFNKLIAQTEAYGLGWIKTGIDWSAGGEIASINAKTEYYDDKKKGEYILKEGRPFFEVVPMYEVFVDNLHATSMSDINELVHRRAFTCTYIQRKWGVKVKPEKMDTVSLAHSPKYTDMAFGVSESDDYAYVYEYYKRPDAEYPEGRYVLMISDQIVFDGKLPYANAGGGRRQIPFDMVVFQNIPNYTVGVTVYSQIIPIQETYNAIKNRYLEYVNHIAIGQMFYWEGSLVNPKTFTTKPGKLIAIKRNAREPKPVQKDKLSNEFIQYLRTLEEDMLVTAGLSQLTAFGSSRSNVRTDGVVDKIDESDQNKLVNAVENLSAAMVEAFKKIIYCEKERVRILREDLKIEEKDCYAIMYKLDNVDVEQLTVANRDFLMQDDQTVDKKLQQAMSMGLYDPNRNLSYLSKMHLVDALQCNYLMDTLDPNEKAQHDLIESEHYDMSDRQIQPQAEYFHLHSQHIVEHNIYRVSPEVRMLKEKEPEQYKALMQMLENHIKQHEDFEKQSKQPDVVSGAKAIFGGTANK